MAQIDTSLLSQVPSYAIGPTALEKAQTQNMLRQGQLNDIQLQQAQQKEVDNALVRQAYNTPDPVNFLAQKGRGDLANAVQQSVYESQAATMEHQGKMQDFISKGLMHVTNDPSDQNIINWANQATQYIPPDVVNESLQQLLAVPAEKRADYIRSLNMTPAQQIELSTPKPTTKTEFDRKWDLFKQQYPNGTYEQFVKLSQSPGTTVTVSTAGPKAEQEAKGKANVDVANEVRTAGNEARKQLVNTDLMEKLLNEGLETGFATETQAKIANALTKLGVKDAAQYATNAQAFQSFVRQNVLNEQMKQKGVQTEGDAQRIEETFARLSNTPDANKFLLATKRAVNNQAIKQQKFWNDWWAKNKTYEGVEEAWLNGEGSKSIFDDPSMKKYAPQPAGAKAAPTRPAGVPANWTLHSDASGNKAWVSPDGKQFKEVK